MLNMHADVYVKQGIKIFEAAVTIKIKQRKVCVVPFEPQLKV